MTFQKRVNLQIQQTADIMKISLLLIQYRMLNYGCIATTQQKSQMKI
jgi:hypothetical protein